MLPDSVPRATAANGWRGRGKVRAAPFGRGLVVRIDGATTRGGRVQQTVREFFRKEYRDRGPDFAAYAVTIWIEGVARHRRFDVDNVAKACLDALSGIVWRDDRQVVRLVVEKVEQGDEAVTLLIEPVEARAASAELERVLRAVSDG